MKNKSKIRSFKGTNELLKVLDELHEKEHYVKDTEIHVNNNASKILAPKLYLSFHLMPKIK